MSQPAARTPDQIEAEIAATRTELTGNIETLQRRLSPASLAEAARDKVVGVIRRDDGSLDPVRASVVAGVVVVLTLYLIRRRRL
ncbi:MAG: DUF3618 domain-containing protein [Actinomycetes bacterium]